MQLNSLKRNTPHKKRRRVGRGGSHGKTAGRGTKGQRARSGHRLRPEMRDFIKRLPKLRGRGKNSNTPLLSQSAIVNLDGLDSAYQVGELVSPKTLLAKNLIRQIDGKLPRVKILGRGTLTKKLTVSKCLVSTSAKLAIEKAGGQVS